MNSNQVQAQVKNVLENVVYIVFCLLTFGGLWIAKIVIKKAVIEANAVSE